MSFVHLFFTNSFIYFFFVSSLSLFAQFAFACPPQSAFQTSLNLPEKCVPVYGRTSAGLLARCHGDISTAFWESLKQEDDDDVRKAVLNIDQNPLTKPKIMYTTLGFSSIFYIY